MATNSVSLSAQSAGLKYEPTLQAQPPLSHAQTVATGEKSNDLIIKKAEVTLVGKPPNIALGQYLTRQALEKIAPEYNLNSTDIDLEIQYVNDKKNGNFISNLNFGKKTVAKPNDLTNEQVDALVKDGNKNVDFGIHQSTIERMLQRTAVVKWIAEKEAFGGQLSTEDMRDLAKLGYTDKDVANLCKAKFMEYGGFQVKFQTEVEAKAKQQVYQDTRNDLKGTLFEEHAKANAQGSEEAFNLLMNAEVKNRVDDKLRYGKKPAIQYLTEQAAEKQRIAEKGELNERLKQYSVGEYLAEGGKNLVNSFYWNVGEAVKGLSLVAMNSSLHIDQNGKSVEPKLSDALGYKIGDWIQQNVQAPNVNRDIEQSIVGGTMPKTVGGLLPAVFGAWATKSPTAAVSIYDGLRTGGSVYDEAIRHQASESEAQRAALITGGFVGLTDRFGYGKTLETLNAGAGATAWQGIFKEAITDGARNAGVAGVQTVGENVIAKNIYDPNRGYLDNVRERMIAAGITGATLKGGLEIIAKLKAGASPQILAQTQQVFRIEKSPVDLPSVKQIEYRNSGVDWKSKLNQSLNKAEETTAQIELKRELEPATVKALNDVSPIEAHNLLKVLDKETLNATASQVGGKRLQTLIENLGANAAKGVIELKAGKSKYDTLNKFADSLEKAKNVELNSPKPLSANSIVLDNNALAGIEKVMIGTPWSQIEPRFQNAVNAIRKQGGLTPLTSDPASVDLKAVIGTAEIRLPNTVIGESTFKLGIKGSGLKLTVDRNSQKYLNVLAELEKDPAVGQPKGFADRAAIADTIFAETEKGVVPKFATNDKGILKQILKFAPGGTITPMPNETIMDAIFRQKPNGFQVEISGHKLFVVPIKKD